MEGIQSAIEGHRRMLKWAESVGETTVAESNKHDLQRLLGLAAERADLLQEFSSGKKTESRDRLGDASQ